MHFFFKLHHILKSESTCISQEKKFLMICNQITVLICFHFLIFINRLPISGKSYPDIINLSVQQLFTITIHLNKIHSSHCSLYVTTLIYEPWKSHHYLIKFSLIKRLKFILQFFDWLVTSVGKSLLNNIWLWCWWDQSISSIICHLVYHKKQTTTLNTTATRDWLYFDLFLLY